MDSKNENLDMCLGEGLNINWYPGHMAKTKKQIQEDLKLIDVVVELLDARIPMSSQNPDIANLIKDKKRIVLLNKSDLSDSKENAKWVKYFESKGITAILTNSNTGIGINEIIKEIERKMEEEMEKQKQKGRIGKPIRIMILGIPNVGKSSLINKMARKNSAQVGNRPGVTKQKQWVKVNQRIDLLDTPGVLWPKFESQEIALNLSYTGTIKDENLLKTEISYYLLEYLTKNYLQNIQNRYKISNEEIEALEKENKTIELMNLIARKRGALLSGNRIDEEKVANILIEDFRNGKIGQITIEKCKE